MLALRVDHSLYTKDLEVAKLCEALSGEHVRLYCFDCFMLAHFFPSGRRLPCARVANKSYIERALRL